MASPITHKRSRTATRTRSVRQPNNERYLTDAQGNRVAVVLDLDEYRQLLQGGHTPSAQSAITWDWLAAARDLRAHAALAPDSTPLLRAVRDERARRG